jgi:hypothetical protein
LCIALLVALASLVACGDDDDNGAVATATTEDVTPTTAGDDSVELALAPDGLVAGDVVTFGTARDDTVAAVSAALGEPAEEGQEDECPAGETDFVRWGEGPDDISLDFQEDAFVGWSLGTESDLQTEAGIGIGSTRAELEAEFGEVDIDETSTIGLEFLLPDSLGGVLDGDAPESLITNLWAGTTCIYR